MLIKTLKELKALVQVQKPSPSKSHPPSPEASGKLEAMKAAFGKELERCPDLNPVTSIRFRPGLWPFPLVGNTFVFSSQLLRARCVITYGHAAGLSRPPHTPGEHRISLRCADRRSSACTQPSSTQYERFSCAHTALSPSVCVRRFPAAESGHLNLN